MLSKIWANRWPVIVSAVGLMGILEIASIALLAEWQAFDRTTDPIGEVQSLDVFRADGSRVDLTRSVPVHHGDVLRIRRTVNSRVDETVHLERVLNSSVAGLLQMPSETVHLQLGSNTMTPVLVIDPRLAYYTIYRYEVVAYDESHMPAVLSDFAICVIPDLVPIPRVPVPCLSPPQLDHLAHELLESGGPGGGPGAGR